MVQGDQAHGEVEVPADQRVRVQLLEVAHHHQVEEAVAVVVAPRAPGRAEAPVVVADLGLLSHVGERAVPVVAEQLARAVVGEEQVLVAVVVVVRRAPAVRVPLDVVDAGGRGHVRERPVAVVVEEGVGADGVRDVHVLQVVVVVVEHDDARSDGLYLGLDLVVLEADARRVCHVDEDGLPLAARGPPLPGRVLGGGLQGRGGLSSRNSRRHGGRLHAATAGRGGNRHRRCERQCHACRRSACSTEVVLHSVGFYNRAQRRESAEAERQRALRPLVLLL